MKKRMIPLTRILGIFSLVILPGQLFAQDGRAMARKGNEAYQNGNYSKAEVKFRKSLKEAKTFNEAKFNLGNALIRQKRYKQAAQQFAKVAKNSDKKTVKAKAYHNLGNAYLKAKNYRKSVKAYKNALRNDPSDKDSRYNLSYALKKLQKQKQKQKKQNKKQQKQNKQQKKKNKNQKPRNSQKKQNKKQEGKQKQNKQQKKKGSRKKRAQKSKGKQKQMSKREIKRMLKALESNEQKVQRKVLKKKRKGKSQDDIQKNW